MVRASDDRQAALADAIAAFDAGNHAFGRFVTYVVRPRGAIPSSVRAVRERLQDAALAVPERPDQASVGEFQEAIREALAAVEAFLAAAPAGYATEEVQQAPEPLREAIDALQPLLDHPDGGA